MHRIATVLALGLVAGACASTQSGSHSEAHDPQKRTPLLDSVKALEGTWEKKGPDGKTEVTEFKVSSAGSIVREIMFPGTDHEMTNVYCLDGNALKVVHYCAMGNQPAMVAESRAGNKLAFHVVGVSDRETPDEMYMGGLILEFVDQDHLTEHWTSYVKDDIQKKDGVDLAFTRRK